MSAKHTALQNVDILEEIVEHIAPGRRCVSAKQGKNMAALTLVTRAFHIPATKALWAELPSVQPLLLLFPEFRRLYRAYRKKDPCGLGMKGVRLSKPIHPEVRARFCDRATLVRILHSYDDPNDGKILSDESWSYLTRLFGGAGPLFPSLRSFTRWEPTTTGEDLRLMASTWLLSVTIYHALVTEGQEDNFVLALQEMLINAPRLTELRVVRTSGVLFARIAPEALRQLRTLRIKVDKRADAAPNSWYPIADALRVLSTLPVLEHLRVALRMDRRDRDFVGFQALKTLHIVDCGNGDATWFLERCSSPLLHELTLDLTDVRPDFEWDDMQPLCSAIAAHAHQLQHLDISVDYFLDDHESEQVPDRMLLAAAYPLLSLRHLTKVSLWVYHGKITLSDAALEALAEAWPELVDLNICVRTLPRNDTDAPRTYPKTATLRSLRAFSRHCPKLQYLHLPHLHVPLQDCVDSGDPEASLSHPLSQLAVCRAVILDVHACALVLHRLFPHVDVDASRDVFSLAHSTEKRAPYVVKEETSFAEPWKSMLNVLAGCQTPTQDADRRCCS